MSQLSSTPRSGSPDLDTGLHTERLHTRRVPDAAKLVRAVKGIVGHNGVFKIEVRSVQISGDTIVFDRIRCGTTSITSARRPRLT
jgi:hypothetical protein